MSAWLVALTEAVVASQGVAAAASVVQAAHFPEIAAQLTRRPVVRACPSPSACADSTSFVVTPSGTSCVCTRRANAELIVIAERAAQLTAQVASQALVATWAAAAEPSPAISPENAAAACVKIAQQRWRAAKEMMVVYRLLGACKAAPVYHLTVIGRKLARL